jgi:hypothetical protein
MDAHIDRSVRRGLGRCNSEPPLPPVPTTAVPGTPEKLVVMHERAKAGFAMFHPADAEYEGDPRPLEFMKNGAG